jgi:O-acetyl-ADP-ribose deacetylase (regulator of RNase III)
MRTNYRTPASLIRANWQLLPLNPRPKGICCQLARWKTGDMRIELVQGDITTRAVDAIVNAANSSLLGGGGVDGAIHRAAGPELLAACKELRRTELPDGLPVGAAVATPGFRLPARWVIHTVGPNRNAGQTDPALLASCFRESLGLAETLGARSVAFPAVSAGVYGWDAREVAETAFDAVSSFAASRPDSGVELVEFVLFSDAMVEAFREVREG